ncbi:MAG: hypothetical protein JXB49_08290 [Bacteroidales bacterium]|nr:hypothetical protein [Bacteroidales bacterium]
MKLLTASMLAAFFILSSCRKEEYDIKVIENQSNFDQIQGEGAIVLGKKLEDPYNFKNIEKAYSNLKATSPYTPNVALVPTHNYIRFLPKNEAEWGILKSDSTFVLYDYPLDYEIAQTGTYYHDPSLPDTAITWQYCVVPKEYNIPGIQHEILYEVFTNEDYYTTKSGKSAELEQFLLDLEEESVRLTGNLPSNYEEQKRLKGLLPSKWTPKGTIKVWDNLIGSTTTYTAVFDHWEYYDCDGEGVDPELKSASTNQIQPIEQCQRAVYRYIPNTTQGSYIPLIGASVHARWFTHIETDLTDANGYFQTSQFRYEVNYAIKWERGFYDIRNGFLFQAWYNGPKKKGDWNVSINGGESIRYATMHRAAYKHFYGDNLGIRRPYLINGGKTKICYVDKPGTGIFWGDWSTTGVLPDIRIWGKDPNTGNYKPLDEVFATTVHELGHQSHSQLIGNIQYWQTDKIIYESWAEVVEWALTNDEYRTMGARFGGNAALNYNCKYTKQLTWPSGDRAYSPIFIDLIDNFNQRYSGWDGITWHNGSSSYPNDRISGYTIQYIQNNILVDSYGLTSLSNAIKNHRITGVTDADIDELFVLYW